MTIQTATPSDLKPQIYDLIEQLRPEQLPELLHVLETWLNGKRANGMRDTALSQAPPIEHPWMKFAGMFKDDAYWEEYLECLAEVRREDNQIEDYEAVE